MMQREKQMRPDKKYRLIIINQILMISIIITVTACSTHIGNWKGAVATPESRVALREGGPHRGSFQTIDLSLNYEYTRNQNNLLLSGFVQLTGRLSTNYEYVDYFFLTINFLDGEGRMLERQTAMTHKSVYRIDDKWYFKRTLITPPETVTFAFSYKGRVVEAEQDSEQDFGNDLFFYLNPLQKAGY